MLLPKDPRLGILWIPGLTGWLLGCSYIGLVRPSVIKQLNPDVVRLVNYLPEIDEPNKAVIARLFAHGGLTRAELGSDGVMRARIRIPAGQFIWRPAVIVMPRGGELELEISNEDQVVYTPVFPSDGDQRVLVLPKRSAGRARLRLQHPGIYPFVDPVGNHAGRGMLGLVIVEGEVPQDAQLDRPPQQRP